MLYEQKHRKKTHGYDGGCCYGIGNGNYLFAATGNTNAEVQEGGNWYEMMVSSFCDSDGDGIGDFRGAEQKLDYLESLGITGIWVMPINKSKFVAIQYDRLLRSESRSWNDAGSEILFKCGA